MKRFLESREKVADDLLDVFITSFDMRPSYARQWIGYLSMIQDKSYDEGYTNICLSLIECKHFLERYKVDFIGAPRKELDELLVKVGEVIEKENVRL